MPLYAAKPVVNGAASACTFLAVNDHSRKHGGCAEPWLPEQGVGQQRNAVQA